MAIDITLDDVRRMAADARLDRLGDDHLQELWRATRLAQTRRSALPTRDLAPADEPAHVYRLDR